MSENVKPKITEATNASMVLNQRKGFKKAGYPETAFEVEFPPSDPTFNFHQIVGGTEEGIGKLIGNEVEKAGQAMREASVQPIKKRKKMW
ncbi:16339_t:CDS:2 [Racocetra fulgida]|uniref:16339_t:CDS:1 n=1 Tax=Racocetra fulgida TaxID=60492 RepID=A0A9N9NHA2_9GLOM|nr:16339_t:CDS:2 [Racocetra fulgida]